MRTITTVVMAAATAFASGCGAYYEDVPAFGESNPTAQVTYARADNPTQVQPVSGQEVNLDQPQDGDEYADTDPSALTDFKSTLDPYGTWQDDAQYGTVWEPDPGVVGSDFQPYVTAGHWAYDNDDYTWVSDYDWGWAPFHYGRWVYIPGRGWSWIPGRRYAGAWVSWRVGEPDFGYIGWGPLAPTWYWRDGIAYDVGWDVSSPYVFCGVGDFFAPSLGGRILAGPQVGVVAGRTHVYTGRDGGRTPAHPTVGPPPSRYGLAPRPLPATATAGIARARAFSRPSTAVSLGAHAPAWTMNRPPAAMSLGRGYVGPDRPVATAPQYRGYAPTPYRVPERMPYRVAPQTIGRGYAPPVYDGGAPAWRGGPVYRGGGPAYRGGGPMYRGGAEPRGPVYRGGGGYRGVPSAQPSYSHPSRVSGGSHFGGSHFGGGRGGGGHFGGGGRGGHR